MAESQPMAKTGPSEPPTPGGFADGYNEGRKDLLFALARGHQWALDALAAERAISQAEAAVS